MKNGLFYLAFALLLAAYNKQPSSSKKRKIRVVYDCYRGCAMDNPFGSGCWVRDYDWTVTASIPIEDKQLFTSEQEAQAYMQQLTRNPDTLEVLGVEPLQQRDNSYYQVTWLTYKNRILGLQNEQNSTSVSWSFSNPESFYAEQAQKMIDKSYENLRAGPYSHFVNGLLNLDQYEPEVIYTKDFNECAEDDMNLNILADFVKQWVLNYLTGGTGAVA